MGTPGQGEGGSSSESTYLTTPQEPEESKQSRSARRRRRALTARRWLEGISSSRPTSTMGDPVSAAKIAAFNRYLNDKDEMMKVAQPSIDNLVLKWPSPANLVRRSEKSFDALPHITSGTTHVAHASSCGVFATWESFCASAEVQRDSAFDTVDGGAALRFGRICRERWHRGRPSQMACMGGQLGLLRSA